MQRYLKRLRDTAVVRGDVSVVSLEAVGHSIAMLVSVTLERERAGIAMQPDLKENIPAHRRGCTRRPTVFHSIPWHLIEKAVAHHTELSRIRLCGKRWLQAPVEHEGGILVERTRGTPQRSAVSPLLANFVLHYAFDQWMQRAFPCLCFERYADDAIVITELKARLEP